MTHLSKQSNAPPPMPSLCHVLHTHCCNNLHPIWQVINLTRLWIIDLTAATYRRCLSQRATVMAGCSEHCLCTQAMLRWLATQYCRHTASIAVQIFSEAADNARWIVPIHHVLVHNMVAMATQADQVLRQNGTAVPGMLSAAATYLQSSIFSDTLGKGVIPHPLSL